MFISVVLNDFIKHLLITKSRDLKSATSVPSYIRWKS